MDNHITVEEAQRNLEEAQRALAEATDHQQKLDSFPTEGLVFLLEAVEFTCGQFVSYAEEGVVIGIFSTWEEAERYTVTFEAPVGLAYKIRELPLHR